MVTSSPKKWHFLKFLNVFFIFISGLTPISESEFSDALSLSRRSFLLYCVSTNRFRRHILATPFMISGIWVSIGVGQGISRLVLPCDNFKSVIKHNMSRGGRSVDVHLIHSSMYLALLQVSRPFVPEFLLSKLF